MYDDIKKRTPSSQPSSRPSRTKWNWPCIWWVSNSPVFKQQPCIQTDAGTAKDTLCMRVSMEPSSHHTLILSSLIISTPTHIRIKFRIPTRNYQNSGVGPRDTQKHVSPKIIATGHFPPNPSHLSAGALMHCTKTGTLVRTSHPLNTWRKGLAEWARRGRLESRRLWHTFFLCSSLSCIHVA